MINTVDYTSLLQLEGVSGQSYYDIGIAETSICQLDNNHVVVVFNDTTNHYLYLDILSFDSSYVFTTVSRTQIKNGGTFIHPMVKKLDDNNFVVAAVNWQNNYQLYLLSVNIDASYNVTVTNDNEIIDGRILSGNDLQYYDTPQFGLDVLDASTVAILYSHDYYQTYNYKVYVTYVFNIDGTQLASLDVQTGQGYYPKVASLGNGYYLTAHTNLILGTYSYVNLFYFNGSSIGQYDNWNIGSPVDNIDLIKISSIKALICYSKDDGNSYIRTITINPDIFLNSEFKYSSDPTYQNFLARIDDSNYGIAYSKGGYNIGYFTIVNVSGDTISPVIDSSYDSTPLSGNTVFKNFGLVNLGNNYMAMVRTANQNNGAAYLGFLASIHFYDSAILTLNSGINIETASAFNNAKNVYIYTKGSWHLAKALSIFTSSAWHSSYSNLDDEAPTTPSNFGVNTITNSSTSLSISWNASTDNISVAGYKLYRSIDNSNWTLIHTFDGADYLIYIDTGLTKDTTYYYRVNAFDAAGNYSGYATGSNKTPYTYPYWQYTSDPNDANISNSSKTGTSITVTWSTALGQSISYDIYYKETSGSTYTKYGTTIALFYTVSGLTTFTSYDFYIVATDSNSNSRTSNTVSIMTASEGGQF